MIEISIDALRAHVGDGANRGFAIHSLSEDAADAEVGDLDTALMVDEEIGGFDVTVDDLAAMEVGEAGDHLTGDAREVGFDGDAMALKRATVHELEEDLDLAGAVIEAVAADDEGAIDGAEDLDLTEDLAADVVVVVAVNVLQGIDHGGLFMADHPDGASGAGAYAADTLKIGEVHCLGERWGG